MKKKRLIIHNRDGIYHLMSRCCLGEHLLEEGEIRQLGLHASRKARELAERISSGEIERLPMITGKRRACEYCPYQGICRIDWQAGDKGRTVPGMSLEQVLQEIRDQR